MNAKLRDWVESFCQIQADGTWRVEVPYAIDPSTFSYILPNIEVKSEYVRRAMRAGLLRLLAVSVVAPLALLAATVELRRVGGCEFSVGQDGLFLAWLCFFGFTGAVYVYEGALRRWLNQVGMVAETQHARTRVC